MTAKRARMNSRGDRSKLLGDGGKSGCGSRRMVGACGGSRRMVGAFSMFGGGGGVLNLIEVRERETTGGVVLLESF